MISWPRPGIRISPPKLDFGEVKPKDSRTLEVEVFNTGTDDLVIRDVDLDGKGFEKASDICSRKSIPSERSCTVGVRFVSPAPGEYTGKLTVLSNAPDQARASVSLWGRTPGYPPPPPPKCPVRRLDLFKNADEEEGKVRQDIVEGMMKVNECVTYNLPIEEAGTLVVCVPPGYSLEGPGFSWVKNELCRLRDDPVHYVKYRKPNVRDDSQVRDVTITKDVKSMKPYRFIFRLLPSN